VNLPSKTIFIRHPTRGRGKPLTSSDFWNLAGRAGRWGKEFTGNIVCIDPSNWDLPPNPSKTKQVIRRATDIIRTKPEELLQYIKDGSPRSAAEGRQDLEFAFGYYYNRFLLNELPNDDGFYLELNAIFTDLKGKVIIPDYIIRRNPGISPIAHSCLSRRCECV
jgi:hypothetical protein